MGVGASDHFLNRPTFRKVWLKAKKDAHYVYVY